jgi:hypothetical protein
MDLLLYRFVRLLEPLVFLRCGGSCLLELSCSDGRVAVSAAAACDVNPLVTLTWSFRVSEPATARVRGRDVHTRDTSIGPRVPPALPPPL